jgi:hypothetical protein
MKLLKSRKYNVTCWDLEFVTRIEIKKRVDPVTGKVTGEKMIELTNKFGEAESIIGEWSDSEMDAVMEAYVNNKSGILGI